MFKKVAAQLESTPKIGDEHELCREWNALFKVCILLPREFGYGWLRERVEAQEALS